MIIDDILFLFTEYSIGAHIMHPLCDIFNELYNNNQYARGHSDGYSAAVNDVKMSTISFDSDEVDRLREFSTNRKKSDENAAMNDMLGTSIKILLLPTYRSTLLCQSFICRQSIHPFQRMYFMKYSDSDQYDDTLMDFFSGTFTKHFIDQTRFKLQRDHDTCIQNWGINLYGGSTSI